MRAARPAILLALCLVLAGCAVPSAAPLREPPACGWALESWRTLDGGWVEGQFVRFRQPVSVDADLRGLWLYDAGHGAVLRLEFASDALTTVLSVRRSSATRLRLDDFGQLYLADPRRGEILRFDEASGETQVFARGESLAPGALALGRGGRVLVGDELAGRVLTFNSLGGREDIARVEQERLGSIGGLAVDGDRLWVSDPVQRRVEAHVDGRRVAVLSHPQLIQPGPLAVDDRGRLIVADTLQRQLFVFSTHAPPVDTMPTELMVASLDDIAVGFGEVYVADGVSSRIQVLGVVPRRCPTDTAKEGTGP